MAHALALHSRFYQDLTDELPSEPDLLHDQLSGTSINPWIVTREVSLIGGVLVGVELLSPLLAG